MNKERMPRRAIQTAHFEAGRAQICPYVNMRSKICPELDRWQGRCLPQRRLEEQQARALCSSRKEFRKTRDALLHLFLP